MWAWMMVLGVCIAVVAWVWWWWRTRLNGSRLEPREHQHYCDTCERVWACGVRHPTTCRHPFSSGAYLQRCDGCQQRRS